MMSMKKYIKHWTNNNQILALTTTKHFAFVEDIGVMSKNLIFADQIHGNKVQVVRKQNLKRVIKNTDGLITKDKNVYLAIRTADCVPIFFYEKRRKIVGIAHSGWRGTYKNIAREMVRNISKIGGRIEDTLVQIGPHICGRCFEVKDDVSSLFSKELNVINIYTNKIYLDLAAVISKQLISENIHRKNISNTDYCTFHHKEYFHSYRRDLKKENYSEMLSIISLYNE